MSIEQVKVENSVAAVPKIKDYSINVPFEAVNNAVDAAFINATKNGPVFFTAMPNKEDAEPGGATHYLNEVYLNAFPEELRQQRRCNCCRDFLWHYGGMVSIDPVTGATTSVLWDPENSPDHFKPVAAALKAAVEKLPVEQMVFVDYEMHRLTATERSKYDYSYEGLRFGSQEKGGFKHFSLNAEHVARRNTQMYSGRNIAEDHKNLSAHMALFETSFIEKAKNYFEHDQVLKCYPEFGKNVAWFHDLVKLHASIKHHYNAKNVIWHAAATNSRGRVVFANTVGGKFIESLQNGYSIGQTINMFTSQVDPKFYMRPTAEATAGNIEQAEKLFKQLGLSQEDMERRAMRLDEVPTSSFIWKQRIDDEKAPESDGSIFGALKEKVSKEASPMGKEVVNGGTMTWVRFRAEVLPQAKRITLRFGNNGYKPTFVVTAAKPGGGYLYKWDKPERRNQVSFYGYTDQLRAPEFNVTPFKETDIVGFINSPVDIESDTPNQNRVFMIVDGLHDTRSDAGLAIFPEDLRPELFPVRATIEMYSSTGTMEGRKKGFGGFWITEASKNLSMEITVETDSAKVKYVIDRFH